MLNTVFLTKVNSKSINDVALPTIASDELRGNAIRLDAMYFWDDAHDEIPEIMFQGKN